MPDVVDQDAFDIERDNKRWWSQFESLIGMKLHAWRNRDGAVFVGPAEPFHLPGSVAKHLLEFLDPQPLCDCGMRSKRFCAWMQQEQGRCLSHATTAD